MIDGRIHHFRPYGLWNGLVILIDQETRSLWDHITGEAIAGPLRGHRLDVWPIHLTTVRAALIEYSNIDLSFSSFRSQYKWLSGTLYPQFIHAQILLPFFFSWTMQGEPDPRLPALTQGLGIVVDGMAKYYPLLAIPSEGLDDRWLNRPLQIRLRQIDGVPRATWSDTQEQPMQLLTRWYGFSFTYPNCELYKV